MKFDTKLFDQCVLQAAATAMTATSIIAVIAYDMAIQRQINVVAIAEKSGLRRVHDSNLISLAGNPKTLTSLVGRALLADD